MAAMLTDAGRVKEAEKTLDKARKLIALEKKPFFPLLLNQGVLYLNTDRYIQAAEALEKALKSAGKNVANLAAAHFRIGQLDEKKGEYKVALAHFKTAFESDRHFCARRLMAEDLGAMGDVYMQLNRPEPAAEAFREAVEIYAVSGNRARVTSIMPKFLNAA